LKHSFLQNYEKIKQGMKKDENVRGNTNFGGIHITIAKKLVWNIIS